MLDELAADHCIETSIVERESVSLDVEAYEWKRDAWSGGGRGDVDLPGPVSRFSRQRVTAEDQLASERAHQEVG
jgi:hypothetical protein